MTGSLNYASEYNLDHILSCCITKFKIWLCTYAWTVILSLSLGISCCFFIWEAFHFRESIIMGDLTESSGDEQDKAEKSNEGKNYWN